jgi:hypothetical protein
MKLEAECCCCTQRKQRSEILQQMVELTGYSHHYAAWLLRNLGRSRLVRAPTGHTVQLVVGKHNARRPTVHTRSFDESVRELVVLLWESFDQMCAKCLVAILPQVAGQILSPSSPEHHRASIF